MKTKSNQITKTNSALSLVFIKTPKFQVRVRKHRAAMHDRFPGLDPRQRKLVDLVLNEAEALAWQTSFPHLVFPTLAEEMAETLAKWRARQETLQRIESEHALAV